MWLLSVYLSEAFYQYTYAVDNFTNEHIIFPCNMGAMGDDVGGWISHEETDSSKG